MTEADIMSVAIKTLPVLGQVWEHVRSVAVRHLKEPKGTLNYQTINVSYARMLIEKDGIVSHRI